MVVLKAIERSDIVDDVLRYLVPLMFSLLHSLMGIIKLHTLKEQEFRDRPRMNMF